MANEWEKLLEGIYGVETETAEKAEKFMEEAVLEATRVSHEAEVKFYINTLAEVKAEQVVCQQSLARTREDLGKSRKEIIFLLKENSEKTQKIEILETRVGTEEGSREYFEREARHYRHKSSRQRSIFEGSLALLNSVQTVARTPLKVKEMIKRVSKILCEALDYEPPK